MGSVGSDLTTATPVPSRKSTEIRGGRGRTISNMTTKWRKSPSVARIRRSRNPRKPGPRRCPADYASL